MGERKLYAVVKQHLRKYCASQAVAHRFPTLKDLSPGELDFFTKRFCRSDFDVEFNSDAEMADLAKFIGNYNRVKTLLDLSFELYFRGSR